MRNWTINYKTVAVKLARQLLGRRPADEELARLARALDGATVNVTVKKKKAGSIWRWTILRALRFTRPASDGTRAAIFTPTFTKCEQPSGGAGRGLACKLSADRWRERERSV